MMRLQLAATLIAFLLNGCGADSDVQCKLDGNCVTLSCGEDADENACRKWTAKPTAEDPDAGSFIDDPDCCQDSAAQKACKCGFNLAGSDQKCFTEGSEASTTCCYLEKSCD